MKTVPRGGERLPVPVRMSAAMRIVDPRQGA
jgi:hypothetical protein